jgi:hypothetical protein
VSLPAADLLSNPYALCNPVDTTQCLGIDSHEVARLALAGGRLRAVIAAAVAAVKGVELARAAAPFLGQACQGAPQRINCVAASPQTIFVAGQVRSPT